MYAPTLGRFLQRDPLGYTDGMNMYAYVTNNPANYLDPMGLAARSVWNGLKSAGNAITSAFSSNNNINYDGSAASIRAHMQGSENGSIEPLSIISEVKDYIAKNPISNKPSNIYAQTASLSGNPIDYTPQYRIFQNAESRYGADHPVIKSMSAVAKANGDNPWDHIQVIDYDKDSYLKYTSGAYWDGPNKEEQFSTNGTGGNNYQIEINGQLGINAQGDALMNGTVDLIADNSIAKQVFIDAHGNDNLQSIVKGYGGHADRKSGAINPYTGMSHADSMHFATTRGLGNLGGDLKNVAGGVEFVLNFVPGAGQVLTIADIHQNGFQWYHAIELLTMTPAVEAGVKGIQAASRVTIRAGEKTFNFIKGANGKTYAKIDGVFTDVGCFTAGTLVHIISEDGSIILKPIEEIKINETVVSYNTQSEKWEPCKIADTLTKIWKGDLATINITHADGSIETIDATGNHPFFILQGKDLAKRPLALEHAEKDAHYVGKQGSRWIDARHIKVGDLLLSPSGNSATVTGLTLTIEKVRVYNFTVDQNHNYVIGKTGILVHNNLCKKLRNKSKRIENQTARGGFTGVSGSVTRDQADVLGHRFVGPNAKTTYDKRTGAKILLSSDGLRQYRATNKKKSSYSRTGYQSNFESRSENSGKWINNVHLDVEG